MKKLNKIFFGDLKLNNVKKFVYGLIILGIILNYTIVCVYAAVCDSNSKIYVSTVDNEGNPVAYALVNASVGVVVDTLTMDNIGEGTLTIPKDKFPNANPATQINVNLTGWGKGYYGSTIKSIGCGANPDTTPTYIYLDTPIELVPPSINLITLVPNATQSNRTVTVVVNATDNYAENLTVNVTINGTTFQLNQTGAGTYSGSFNASLVSGNYTVTVNATDASGNSNSTTRNLIVDNTPPTVSALTSNDTDNLTKGNATIKFSVNASDANGIANVTLNGTLMSHTTGNTWELNSSATALGCAEGSCLLVANAMDNVSNSATTGYTLTVDDTPPSGLSILINNGAAYTTSAAVNLTLTAVNATQCRYNNDSGSWTAWEAYSTTRAWNLANTDGNRTVYYQCKDAAGNEAPAVNDSIILDTVNPAISNVIPNNGNTSIISRVVSFSVSDAVPGSGVNQSSITVKVNNSNSASFNPATCTAVTGGFNCSYYENGITTTGSYNLKIDAKDNSGRSAVQASTAFNFIPSGPTELSIKINNNALYTTTKDVVLNLSAQNASFCWYKNDGGNWTEHGAYTAIKNWNLTDSDGVRTVSYQCNDSNGDISAAVSDTIILDKLNPTVTPVQPLLNQLTNSSTISFIVNDSASGVNQTSISVKINGVNSGVFNSATHCAQTGSYTCAYSETGLIQGSNNLTIYVQDNAGRSNETNITFIYDSIAPTTTNNATPGWKTSDFSIGLNCTDATSGCNVTRYKIDNGAWQNGSVVQINTDGNHTVYYYSMDNAGNTEAIKNVSAALDKTLPEITISVSKSYTKDGIFTVYSNSTTITATITDTISGFDVNSFNLIVTGNANCSNDSIVNISVRSFSCNVTNGTFYNVTVSVKDNAGNNNSNIKNFTVDTSGPMLVVAASPPPTPAPVPAPSPPAPPDSWITSQTSVTINGTTDANATVTVNGINVTVNASGKFSKLVNLNEGTNTINITATLNNVPTPKQIIVIRDTQPPAIHSINMSPNVLKGSGNVTITVNASDIQDTNLTVNATINGTTIVLSQTAAGTYNGTFTAPSNSSVYIVTVTAKDDAGNSKSNNSNLIVDNDGPAISISKTNICVVSTVVNSNSITITSTITDPLSGPNITAANISLISNKVTVTTINTTTNVTNTTNQSLSFNCSNISVSGNTSASISCNLTNGGNYTVIVYARDNLGNNKTINETFKVDTTCKPPAPVESSGSRGGTGTGGGVNVTTVCGDGKCQGTEDYMTCSKDCQKPPECTKDSDCPGGKICTGNNCRVKPECTKDSECEVGKICTDEKCVAKTPECTKDSDCTGGKICKDEKCVAKTPECTKDSDCATGKICTDEKCVAKPIVCGDGKCEGDETCENCEKDCGACKKPELIVKAPSDLKAGETATLTVTDDNGKPVPNAVVKVIMPDGSTKTYTTDVNGNIQITSDESGKISIAASKAGYSETDKSSVSISVTGETPWSWYLLPLLIILMLFIFLLFRRKKGTEEKGK